MSGFIIMSPECMFCGVNCYDPEAVGGNIQESQNICEGKLVGKRLICANCLYQLRRVLGIEDLENEIFEEDILEGGEVKNDKWQLW